MTNQQLARTVLASVNSPNHMLRDTAKQLIGREMKERGNPDKVAMVERETGAGITLTRCDGTYTVNIM